MKVEMVDLAGIDESDLMEKSFLKKKKKKKKKKKAKESEIK